MNSVANEYIFFVSVLKGGGGGVGLRYITGNGLIQADHDTKNVGAEKDEEKKCTSIFCC